MRAALSILQMQRQQSLRDIRDLDKLKAAAMRDPEGFVSHLREGKLEARGRGGVEVDLDDEDDEEEGDGVEGEEVTTRDGESEGEGKAETRFSRFPGTQNIVRAPPVEWGKYGIVGEPLEQMHEFQRRYPGGNVQGGQQLQPHQVAGPYRPFTDRVVEGKK
jgi:hypothetical protein